MKTNNTILYCLAIILMISIYSKCDTNKDTKKGKTINGLKQGRWESYDSKDRLSAIYNYLNDTLNGIQQIFHENGIVCSESYYVKGIMRYSKAWFENGRKSSELYFNEFERSDSICLVWHENGEIRQKGFLRNGKMIGLWTDYNEQGGIIKVIDYDTVPQ